MPVGSNRGHYPADVMEKVKVGESLFIVSDLPVYLKAKHDVYVVSAIQKISTINIQSTTYRSVTKPKMIVAYNTYM